MKNASSVYALAMFTTLAACTTTAPTWKRSPAANPGPTRAAAPAPKVEPPRVAPPDDLALGQAALEARDYVRARQHLAASCQAGVGVACGRLGIMLVSGIGGEIDVATGQPLLAKGCRANDPSSCAILGMLVKSSAPKQARVLLAAGCEGQVASGCRELGRMVDEGLGGPEDPGRAVQLWTQACGMNDADACAALGRAFRDGRGLEADATQARALFTRACLEKSAPGCASLGAAWRKGIGGPADAKLAVRFLARACDLGDAKSCREAADVVEDPESKATLWDLACKQGDGHGCYELGRVVAKDAASRFDYIERACTLDFGLACRWVGQQLYHEGRQAEAMSRLERGCNLEDAPSCEYFGAIGGDPAKTVAPMQKACRAKDGAACVALAKAAQLNAPGIDPRLTPRALLDRACTLGTADGCVMLAQQLARAPESNADELRALSLLGEQCDKAPSAQVCNGLAWLFATARSAMVRNGYKAVRYAKRARRMAETPVLRAVILDTIAAGYAAQGNFERARRTQSRAIRDLERLIRQDTRLSHLRGELAEMKARAVHYRAGRAHMTPASAMASRERR